MIVYSDFWVHFFSGNQPWVAGVTVEPYIFVLEKYKGEDVHKLIDHEKVHLEQEKDLGLALFLFLYFLAYLKNGLKNLRYKGSWRHYQSYHAIVFEEEARRGEAKNIPLNVRLLSVM